MRRAAAFTRWHRLMFLRHLDRDSVVLAYYAFILGAACPILAYGAYRAWRARREWFRPRCSKCRKILADGVNTDRQPHGVCCECMGH